MRTNLPRKTAKAAGVSYTVTHLTSIDVAGTRAHPVAPPMLRSFSMQLMPPRPVRRFARWWRGRTPPAPLIKPLMCHDVTAVPAAPPITGAAADARLAGQLGSRSRTPSGDRSCL